MAAGKKLELCRRGKNNEKEGEKSLMSGQNMHLKRFKNQNFSYQGEGVTPLPGPHIEEGGNGCWGKMETE